MPDDPNLSMNAATDPNLAGKPAEGDPAAKPAEGDVTPPAIDQKAFDTMKEEHGRLTQFVSVLKERGITTSDDLKSNLDLVAQINKNAEMKGVIGDLLSGKGAQVDPTPAADPAKLDAAGIQALVSEQIAKALQADQTQRATEQFNVGSATENTLKSRVLADPRFKAIMGGADFEKAMKGDGSKAAQLVAIAADHLFFEAGSATSNGQYAPVTNEAAVKQVADKLVEMFTELKTQAIMDASQDSQTVDKPDAPQGTESGDVRQVAIGGAFDWPDEESQKDAEAVKATFEAAFRKASAQGGKLPASQQI